MLHELTSGFIQPSRMYFDIISSSQGSWSITTLEGQDQKAVRNKKKLNNISFPRKQREEMSGSPPYPVIARIPYLTEAANIGWPDENKDRVYVPLMVA